MTEFHAPTLPPPRALSTDAATLKQKSWLKQVLIRSLTEDLSRLRKEAKEAARGRDRSALGVALFMALSNIAGMRDIRGAFVFLPFTLYALWRAWSLHGMYKRTQQEIACHRLSTDLELSELRDES